MTGIIDLPNPFAESASSPSLNAENSTVAPSHLDEVAGAAVVLSPLEVVAMSAPGMARDLIEIPSFLSSDISKSETGEA